MNKPANLVYGVEEMPPTSVLVISAIQHVGVIAIFLIYPLIIGHSAGAPADEIANVLRFGMIALAVAVLLQALPRGPVGSRFLAPSIFTGIFLAPSVMAAKVGGFPLVWGMTIFAGLFEAALSQAWSRLRTFVPSETAGLVVFLIGVIIGLAAIRVLLHDSVAGAIGPVDGAVALLTFAVMVALNVWNKGKLRLFCVIIGIVVGYIAAAVTGLLTARDLDLVLHQPLFALPSLSWLSWSFDASLIVPFAVTGLASAMATAAVVTTYQKTTDAGWIRPEPHSIRRGILGDGLANVVAGLLGTYGMSVSTANVGLVAATGVATRRMAYLVAPILVLAAFQPNFIGVLQIMPVPVMAAALMFTAVFIMISGVQIITMRILDSRRTLVIGMGMMAFVVSSVFPSAFASAPHWLQPLVNSPLVLATLVALGLNLLFRLGIRRKVATTVDPKAADFEDIGNFVERNAAIWGARRDVTQRVKFAVQQAVEAIIDHCRPGGPIVFEIGYDEFDIDVALVYPGEAVTLADAPPTHEEVLESSHGTARLAGFLIQRQSDKVQTSVRDGTATLRLHFRH
jgi:NCS2 family nucleobase:cation symporter-2